MIIVDEALARREREGRPIQVGLVGAGFMGGAIVRQISRSVPGMRVAAIANRTLAHAHRAYAEAGLDGIVEAQSDADLVSSLLAGRPAVTTDPESLCRAPEIDAIVEVTGTTEHGARVTLSAIEAGKHVVLMNAELDATVGPLLKAIADEHGVVYTASDGDQPGVTGNLIRYVRGLGVRPVMCGNIKGFHDVHRNPTTQAEFAQTWRQSPQMVSSFADGTKIAFEQATVANATGMQVAQRGMIGPSVPRGTPLAEVVPHYPADPMLKGPGLVDYVVGAEPAPGVFVLGTHDDPEQQRFLELYKLGKGPFYCFYHPYHLCHFEVHNSVARAVLFNDATLAPAGPPAVDVVCAAKIDLHPGDLLDGPGGYTTYGLCENADVARAERLLPSGLAEGCRVRRAVPRDQVITRDDVELPEGRLIDALRERQDAAFAGAIA